MEVKLNSPVETATASTEGERLVMEPGIIIAIVIASVGGFCCITLIMLQVCLYYTLYSFCHETAYIGAQVKG